MTMTAITALLVTALAVQQDAPKAALKLDSDHVVAGSLVRATVSLTFSPGLHGYQNPPSEDYMIPVAVQSVEGAVQLSVRYPKGIPNTVGGETKPVMTYSGTINIPVLVRIPETPGQHELKVTVGYQQCTDQACFPPNRVVAATTVTAQPVPDDWNAVKRRGHDLALLNRWNSDTQ